MARDYEQKLSAGALMCFRLLIGPSQPAHSRGDTKPWSRRSASFGLSTSRPYPLMRACWGKAWLGRERRPTSFQPRPQVRPHRTLRNNHRATFRNIAVVCNALLTSIRRLGNRAFVRVEQCLARDKIARRSPQRTASSSFGLGNLAVFANVEFRRLVGVCTE